MIDNPIGITEEALFVEKEPGITKKMDFENLHVLVEYCSLTKHVANQAFVSFIVLKSKI